MPKRKSIRSLLSGGDRRSIGASEAVAARVLADSGQIGELVELLWNADPVVRMRAADALEKISRERSGWLQTYKAELLGLMAEAEQPELRWHLAAIVPRLELTKTERRRALETLRGYVGTEFGDRSSIVKTMAMQGMWDLTAPDAEARLEVVELIQVLTRTGTPAMRARGRKLLRQAGASEAR